MERQGIEKQRNEWLQEIPQRFRITYRKAMEGHSLRAAVNAKCQDCMNWQIKEVHRCDVVICPLWPYRPVSRIRKDETAG